LNVFFFDSELYSCICNGIFFLRKERVFDPDSWSRSRQAKIVPKKGKKWKNFTSEELSEGLWAALDA
jgi:hypothetical protein